MNLLAELRAQGVAVLATDRGRVRLPASTPGGLIARARAQRDALLDALQDEAEAELAMWPYSYRRWCAQTGAYCLNIDYETRAAFWAAYGSIAAEYAEHRTHVAGLPLEDQMLRAALEIFPGAHLEDG